MIQHHRRYLDERQKHERWMDPRLHAVRVADLQAYLLAKGWKPMETDRPGFLVFEEPAQGTAELLYQFVPESEEWEGYAAQVYDLIAALAEFEDRYAGDVLTDILRLRDQTNGNGAVQEPRRGTTVLGK